MNIDVNNVKINFERMVNLLFYQNLKIFCRYGPISKGKIVQGHQDKAFYHVAIWPDDFI